MVYIIQPFINMSKECKEDKEKNPFTNYCVKKCNESEERIINKDKEIFKCKKTKTLKKKKS